MKISYNWLQETLGFDLSPQELADRLAAAGSQVDSITPLAPGIVGVVVAELLEVKPHPNADRLSLTRVSDGDMVYDVVCGAHNISPGDRVPLAKVDAVLPGDVRIKRNKIRGEVSEGMLCSAQELQLQLVLESDGILLLPKDAPIGMDINAYLGLSDSILDIELTADRGDLLSLRGLTAEIGAILGKPFRLPAPQVEARGGKGLPVAIATDNCTFYCAQLIRGVKVGPSPLWLQLRLLACGLRPVNNIVDAANLVMLEWGQPLHTFDADKLPQPEITVRQALPGEKIVTLDGKERPLTVSMMLITSGSHPVAIAGVMGSLESAVDGETVNLLVESALFDPISVRRTAKSLGLSSEAGLRFEKGVDPRVASISSQRVTSLIVDLAGGEIGGETQAGSDHTSTGVIPVKVSKINGLLGTDISRDETVSLLNRLGLAVAGAGDNLEVQVDDRRRDLLVWQDMAEEVGRLHGFDKIPATLPRGELTLGVRKPAQSLEWQVRELMVACGLSEVATYSFISPEAAAKTLSEPGVAIANPLTREASVMRGSILPSLLETVAYNFAYGQDSVAIFEVANIYRPSDPLPAEDLRVAGALAGQEPGHWQHPPRAYDFYALKGILEKLLSGLAVAADFRPDTHRQFHPGRCASLWSGGVCLGFFGQVHPAIAAQWKLEREVWVFDLAAAALTEAAGKGTQFVPPSRYPAVCRDLALETDANVAAGELMGLIRQTGGQLLEEVECFDVFTGGNLPPGRKSLAFSLSFRHPQRTLQEKEVQKLIEVIIKKLESGGANLRR